MPAKSPRPDLISALEEFKLHVLRCVRKVVPATVTGFKQDPEAGAVVEVQIARLKRDEQGRTEKYAIIPDVAVIYPGFGDFVVAGELEKGQPVLLIVADSEISQWLDGAETYVPSKVDAPHSLSQCLAFPMAKVGAARALHSQAGGLTVGKLDGSAMVRFNAAGTEATVQAATTIKLGAGATPAQSANRTGDAVVPSAAMAAWALVVETAVNTLAPGTFTPANSFAGTVATAFAVTGPGSAKTKVE